MAVIPVYEGREPYIFVSYSHRDSGTVLPVVRGLYEDKYRVWYDEGIAPGSEWPHNIAVHLENAAVVAAFISDNSKASINCENEIVRAAELGKFSGNNYYFANEWGSARHNATAQLCSLVAAKYNKASTMPPDI